MVKGRIYNHHSRNESSLFAKAPALFIPILGLFALVLPIIRDLGQYHQALTAGELLLHRTFSNGATGTPRHSLRTRMTMANGERTVRGDATAAF